MRIRTARQRSGFSQEQLGKLLGVSKSAVSQWETGATNNIRPENLLLLEKHTKHRAWWIVFGQGPEQTGDNALSDDETLLLSTFRQLDAEGQRQILRHSKLELNENLVKEKETHGREVGLRA